MTKKERMDYWHKWNRFQQKYEKYYEKKFTQALQIQVKAFLKTQDVMSIPSYPIYTVLNDLYKTVGPKWARVTRMDVNKATGQMGFNAEIVALMQEYYGIDLLNDAENITAYSRQIISKILGNAAIMGLSNDDIVRMITTSTELGPMRARRIARTETVTASNGAAMIYAKKSGLEMTKTWISVQDNRTRHNQWANHLTIDGMTEDYDKPFTLTSQKLGQIQMMQPGVRTQPNGLPVPAVEVVNCRCVVGFEGKRDARGRLIRRR
jgi:hypothetical protein